MNLHDEVEAALKTAMKARDRARMSALRMLIAELKNRAVADGLGPQGRLPDETVIKVMTTEVKRRREAAQAFDDAGRAEQAANEQAEAAVYEEFLPEQLSDDELGEIVDRAISATGASGPSDMGQTMKQAMAEVAGRADGSRVSQLVRQRLTDA